VPQACVVGVDLGGTNVRACAYLHDGTEAGAKFTNPSNAHISVEAVANAVSLTIRQAVESSSAPVQAVGIGIPGHIDELQGLVRWAPNFRMSASSDDIWRDVPLKSLVAEQTGLALHTGNDANLAALGEYRFGMGKNSARCLVMITLGTGVGGGVVFSPVAIQGKSSGPLVLLGGNQGGAELGHVCIDPISPAFGPGAQGSLESFCGAAGITGRAKQKLESGRNSSIDRHSAISPRILFEEAQKGDGVSLEVWKETGHFLGLGLGSFINLFAPDVIAIGGQVAKASKFFLESAKRTAKAVAIPTLFSDVNIAVAERVEDAGILGAAALALEAIQ
jgi:glucokinase